MFAFSTKMAKSGQRGNMPFLQPFSILRTNGGNDIVQKFRVHEEQCCASDHTLTLKMILFVRLESRTQNFDERSFI